MKSVLNLEEKQAQMRARLAKQEERRARIAKNKIKRKFKAFVRRKQTLPSPAQQERILAQRLMKKARDEARKVRREIQHKETLLARKRKRDHKRYLTLKTEKAKLDNSVRQIYKEYLAAMYELRTEIVRVVRLLKESETAYERRITEARALSYADGFNQGLAEGKRIAAETHKET